MNERLIIMARSPELGKVKSRLAKTVGEERALEVYRKLLDHTLQCAVEAGFDTTLFVEGDMRYFENSGWKYKPQSQGDLGEKMKAAFTSSFVEGVEKIVMIGTDCIELSHTDLKTSFEALSKNDLVLGPAMDGGYYLIGMKKMHQPLMDNMPWSTSNLLVRTIEEARHLSLSIQTLPIKNDIDEEADLLGTGL